MYGIRDMMTERRKHARQNIYLPFEFRLSRPDGGRATTGRGITINVGRDGALLLMPPDGVEPGRVLSLSILMDQFRATLAKAASDKNVLLCRGAGNARMEVAARVSRLQKLSGMGTLGDKRLGVAVEFEVPRDEFDPAAQGVGNDADQSPTEQGMEVQR
jgi:hypothetical protein